MALSITWIGSTASAQEKKEKTTPPGKPFQILQRQIDALKGQLEEGLFEQVRILSLEGPSTLFFGETDDCTVGINPEGPAGLLLRDPSGIRILDPSDPSEPTIFWGPTNDCSIGLDARLPGLVERDPVGFRLLGPNNQGCRLIFGPTLDCTVEVDPEGPAGLLLRDPSGIRILNPLDPLQSTVFWGPSNECSIGLDPTLTGLVERDPVGFRLLGRDDQGCRLLFGPTDLCTVEVDPTGPAGLLLRDPRGIRILNPDPEGDPTIVFGETDNCRILAGEIGVNDQGQQLLGLILEDPGAVAIRSPIAGGRSTLVIGDDARCQISTAPGDGLGMIFTDPERFLFDNDMEIQGAVTAQAFIVAGPAANMSQRRMKDNIRTISDALDKVRQLRGVYFDWKPEHGGQPDLGFVAEEVADVLPEATVYEEDGETPMAVKYANIVAVAVEGIKAQQEQIDELQRSNTELTAQMSEMQAQLDELSSRVGPRPSSVALLGLAGLVVVGLGMRRRRSE